MSLCARESQALYKRLLRVRLSEVDPKAVLRLQSLFDWFQDSGCEHSASLGMGAADLLTHNHTWVLLKYHVTMSRCPVWNEEVSIVSWRSPLNDLYDLRRYEIRDARGRRIATATSAWVIMDFITRKPTRLSRCLEEGLLLPKGAIEDPFERIAPVKNPGHMTDFRVRVSDLDFNGHVNNAIYIGWALEALSESFLDTHRPRRVEVRFVKEITRGKGVLSEAQFEKGPEVVSLHRVSGRGGEGELMRMSVLWEKVL